MWYLTMLAKKVLDKLKGANICKVDSKVKKVMICHRQYLGTKEDGKTDDEFGGVSLPRNHGIGHRKLQECSSTCTCGIECL